MTLNSRPYTFFHVCYGVALSLVLLLVLLSLTITPGSPWYPVVPALFWITYLAMWATITTGLFNLLTAVIGFFTFFTRKAGDLDAPVNLGGVVGCDGGFGGCDGGGC